MRFFLLGAGLSKDQAVRVWEQLDENGNGKVSYPELRRPVWKSNFRRPHRQLSSLVDFHTAKRGPRIASPTSPSTTSTTRRARTSTSAPFKPRPRRRLVLERGARRRPPPSFLPPCIPTCSQNTTSIPTHRRPQESYQFIVLRLITCAPRASASPRAPARTRPQL